MRACARCGSSGCGFLLGLLVLIAAVSAVIRYWPVAIGIVVAFVIACRIYARTGGPAGRPGHDAGTPESPARYGDRRFRALTHSSVPCNDGGINFGQAVVAAARDRAPASAPAQDAG